MDFVWILAIAFGLGIAISLFAMASDRNQAKAIKVELAGGEFVASESHFGPLSGIAYDSVGQRLRLVMTRGKVMDSIILGGEDIVETRIYDSGTVVAQTGGGIVGGMVGGVGLGVMGKRTNKMTVDVSLQVVVRDPARPSWTISFAQSAEMKATYSEPIRSNGLALARHWYGIVTFLAASPRT